jgi:hypothetical protein
MNHPYKGKPDYQFWSRAVTWAPPGGLDPVTAAPFQITRDQKVATLGSCFAQHLARHIQKIGLNYFVTEQPPGDMPPEEAKRQNYGVFTARYGNVYTAQQAVQLFDRAFGRFAPKDDVWPLGDAFVDALRPSVQAGGWSSPAEVRVAREEHLGCVRAMFTKSDVIVFTLGLTEAWRSRTDGTVFANAPGVAGGSFDPAVHERVNFTAEETTRDLFLLIDRVRSVNRHARILLTVSPVPLIATHEDRHVVVSTILSKSALRVAAAAAESNFPWVTYFPSYEIIISPQHGGSYFESDLRSVSERGVAHVMRVFSRHYVASDATAVSAPPTAAPTEAPAVTRLDLADVVCDEELIEKTLRQSGLG